METKILILQPFTALFCFQSINVRKLEYPWWNNPIDFSDIGLDTLSGILFLVDQTCSDKDGDIIKEWSDYELIEDDLNVCSHLGLGSDAEFTLTKWKGGA